MDVVRARHVVCVLGNGWDPDALDALAQDVGGPGFELDRSEFRPAPDPRMRTAFEYSMDRANPTFTGEDWAGIEDHGSVAYLLSPPIDPGSALDVSARMLAVTAAVLAAGGAAAKGESSGIAHGRKHWLALAERAEAARKRANGARTDGARTGEARTEGDRTGEAHTDSAGTEAEQAAFDLVDALQQAWVRRPIRDGELVYTCGMHLLGQPDIEFELDPAAGDDILGWLEVFALYLLVERPSIRDGDTFRPAGDLPRRRLRATPCTRYEEDDFFFNPHGYWRLLRADGGQPVGYAARR